MKTNRSLTRIFALEKTWRRYQHVMSNEIHFYSEGQETEDVSKNELLMESLLSHEG